MYFNSEKIICANAGDSRAVLFSNDETTPLSEDHKPDNTGERTRIELAKHCVLDSRIDGNLAVSRAFGDFQYKDQDKMGQAEQAVSPNPDIKTLSRTAKDEFVILACDGIWDCLTSDECTGRVKSIQK